AINFQPCQPPKAPLATRCASNQARGKGRWSKRSKTVAGATRPQRLSMGCSVSHAAEPIVDVLLHLIPRMPIAGLYLSFELLAVAVDLRQIVIGEFAPFLLNLAGHLFPVAFDTAVHR